MVQRFKTRRSGAIGAEGHLNFALGGSNLPATFLGSALVCGADLSLLLLQLLQLPLGLLQLLSGLQSLILQCCDLVAVLLVQGLGVFTLNKTPRQ